MSDAARKVEPLSSGTAIKRRDLRSTLLHLVVVMVSTITALVLAEVSLRAAGVSYPLLFNLDPSLGYVHRPGEEGFWSKEGHAFVRFNRDGMRDKERAIQKPRGTFRIALLGDSYTEALQVQEKDMLSVKMEQQLSDCSAFHGQKVEVLNFGTSGYGTAQELLQLREQVWKYGPDAVVLAFLPMNDIRNNSRDLEPDRMRPFFYLQDGRLLLDLSFRRGPEFSWQWMRRRRIVTWLVNQSRILQVIREGIYRHKNKASRQPRAPSALRGDEDVSKPPRSPLWEQAWQVTEALLTIMQREVLERHALFALLIIDDDRQVHPDPAVRRSLGVGEPPPHYAVERLKRIAKDAAIPALSLAEPLNEYVRKTGEVLHGFPNAELGFGHWNENGHREAAKYASRFLCDLWWTGQQSQ